MASYPGECKHDRLLAITVVPWISEWLIYYELWLVTGRWLGGGHTSTADSAAHDIEGESK
jgi:hypothetical protein